VIIRSRLMYWIAAGGLAIIVGAASANAFSDAAVKDAEDLLDRTKRALEMGMGNQSDVALAEYNVIDMQYKAGQITHAKYCQSALPVLRIIADLAQNQARNGQARSVREEIDAKRQWYGTMADCKKK
jgi:histidine ammonia-lyase